MEQRLTFPAFCIPYRMMIDMTSNDTIAAIATPNAAGSVSVIRISGPEAVSTADRIFRPVSGRPLSTHKGYTGAYGTAFDAEGEIDNIIAFVYRAPKSYTGEEVVELSCHGGIIVTRRLLRAVLNSGARLAEPGEFTKRAFLNGKMTLTQAESVMDLVNSQSEQAARCAMTALDGALYRKISGIRDRLIAETAHITAWIDFPEEDVDEVKLSLLRRELLEIKEELKNLIRTFDVGRVVHMGLNTVIVGRPNVGKSTLMNLLAGCEKSIVTDTAGTTRDIVEETVNLGDVVLRLADTAGIRRTSNSVELAGIDRAKKRIAEADLVLLVLDVSRELEGEDLELMRVIRSKPTVVILNKSDLGTKIDVEYIKRDFKHNVIISAKEESSAAILNQEISRLMNLTNLDTNQPILANERQRACADAALSCVVAALDALSFGMTLDAVNLSIEDGIEALLQLTGESVSEVVVDEVFSRFCVGK